MNTVIALALAASLGQQPYPYNGGGESWEGGQIVQPTLTPGAYGEPLYPYDQQDPWLHGYHQRMPSYRGHSAFRPYNYKHVLSQSQTAAGWGINPTRAYSQQYWHRYQSGASLNTTGIQPADAAGTIPNSWAHQPGIPSGWKPVSYGSGVGN